MSSFAVLPDLLDPAPRFEALTNVRDAEYYRLFFALVFLTLMEKFLGLSSRLQSKVARPVADLTVVEESTAYKTNLPLTAAISSFSFFF